MSGRDWLRVFLDRCALCCVGLATMVAFLTAPSVPRPPLNPALVLFYMGGSRL